MFNRFQKPGPDAQPRAPSVSQPANPPAVPQPSIIPTTVAQPANALAKAPAAGAGDLDRAADGVVIIGKGARIEGQIKDCTLLDVHGLLDADITAGRLIVRDGGGVRGSIQTGEAEIHGVVEGDLTVLGHLDIRATGDISGNVSYDTMASATGGRIRGNMVVREQVGAAPVEEAEFGPVDQESGAIIDFTEPFRYTDKAGKFGSTL